MLSPRKSRPALLPEDYKLIETLGCSEAEYRNYLQQVSGITKFRPGEPTAFLIVPFLVTLVIGVVLNYVASLLAPKPSTSKPARLENKTVDGQDIVRSGRFAPKSGFDSPQNVVELGSVVPIVFAKREVIDGKAYGGVRINTNLLWSQTYSLGTAQLLRSVFMIGGSQIGAIDPYQIAIGDNLLSQYELNPTNNDGGRVSFYFRNDGQGRIEPSHHLAGRLPEHDEGNAERNGGPDVFAIRGVNNAWTTDFCYTTKPANQTQFGLYGACGNDLGYRVNPIITPASIAQLVPKDDKGNSRVVCTPEAQVKAQREKQDVIFASRAGVVKRNGNNTSHNEYVGLDVGDTFVYTIQKSSDYSTKFKFDNPGGPDGTVTCIDVAQAVAGRQRTWDDNIVIGELYQFGQALAVCIERLPAEQIFTSAADREPAGGGTNIDAKFRVVRTFGDGASRFTSYERITRDGDDDVTHWNGTQTSHLFRVAIASFVIDRPTQVIEIGVKSSLGVRYSGMMNYRDAISYTETDAKSCDSYEGQTVSKGEVFTTTSITSGTYTGPDVRYSFHRVGFRIGGSDDDFTYLPQLIGFRSQTLEATYNSFRLEFPSTQRWEVEIRPVSGWAIRENYETGNLIVIDNQQAKSRVVHGNGAVLRYTGETLSRTSKTFELVPTHPKNGDLGINHMDGNSYVDQWGKLAEVFMQEEVQSSASSPEHEIAYINLISRNTETPLYDNLSLLGMNLRSSLSVGSLSQLSVYVNKGFSADLQGEHRFPSCAYLILTDTVFGTGDVVPPILIDRDSFDYCDTWTAGRKYFFDIGISSPENAPSKLTEWAGRYLLDLMRRGGRYYMEPIAEFGKIYNPIALYTSGNINLSDPDDPESESTLVVSYREQSARDRIRVSVKWREERLDSDITGRGLFPVIRELNVREAGTSENSRLVEIDMSEYCTSEEHALDVAKMECRKRLITHDVQFEAIPEQAPLQPGAIIKLGMEVLTYSDPNNGVILEDGTVVFNGGGADGSYDVALWDGIANDIQEATINVVDGKVSGYNQSVFTLATVVSDAQIFKVQKLDFTETGDIEVVASHYPLLDDGTSALLEDWNDPDAWLIEGYIGTLPDDEDLSPVFTAVQILGPTTLTVGETAAFTSAVYGPAGAYTYQWAGAGLTIATPTADATTITFPGAGTYTITLSVNLGAEQKTDTHTVIVSEANLIGVTITGPLTGNTATAYTYTATIDGPPGSYTYSWSTTAAGVITNPSGSSVSITWPTASAGLSPAISVTVTNANGDEATGVLVIGLADDTNQGTGVVIDGPEEVAVNQTEYYQAINSTNIAGSWAYEWEIVSWVPDGSFNQLIAKQGATVFNIVAKLNGVDYTVTTS
jgi:hypothetical protein